MSLRRHLSMLVPSECREFVDISGILAQRVKNPVHRVDKSKPALFHAIKGRTNGRHVLYTLTIVEINTSLFAIYFTGNAYSQFFYLGV